MTSSTSRLSEIAARLRERRTPARLVGLRGAARAVAIARLLEAQPEAPALVIAIGAKAADALLEDLRLVLGEPRPEQGGRVRAFPAHDTTPYDRFSPQPFVVAQRMDVLHRLAAFDRGAHAGPPPVVVAPWTALAPRVPSREAVLRASLAVVRGEALDRDGFVGALVAAGYARQSVVEERGEVAVRGGVVDFFPPHLARPVRIELFGDEVESLREFDPASQRSQAELERVVAPPPRELLVTRELAIERGDAIRAAALTQGVAAREADQLIDGLLRGSLPPGAEALAPLIQ
ncbi:MAG TPA: transcription-repair coupling factor, partial [Myxococcota bacterium]|nr:transcription-repair coupling factor [Myxococcota bacterium]